MLTLFSLGGVGGGGGGRQKVPALTLDVNNLFFLILEQTFQNLVSFPKIYLATIWYDIWYDKFSPSEVEVFYVDLES